MPRARDDDTLSERPTLGRTEPEKEKPAGANCAWSEEDAERETLDRPADSGEAGVMTLTGRYKVLRRLGEGGMGSVWLAEDLKLDGRRVAIKMLPAVLAGKKTAYRQVKQEALMAMKLAHPNIATVRAFEEEEGGNPFLVMDYIEGMGLDEILAEKGKLSEVEMVKLLSPVAAALDYAHAKGVVHRDVKPGNVMVAKDGTPYVLDFGIAREIQETMTRVTGKFSSGTLLYMSPEQLNGRAPKAAQDVYSFAAMAYECLKGEPPFARGQIEWQIMNNPPEPLPEKAGDRALREGVMSGLAKKPEGRPRTCRGVLDRGSLEQGRSILRTSPKTEHNAPGGNNTRHEAMDEGVFLRKVQLEKMLEKSYREEMNPAELERLAKARTLFAAGEEAMHSGQITAAAALYMQTEEALRALRTAFTARRKGEIHAERARRDLEHCREIKRKALEEEGRRREEASRKEEAKRAEEEKIRTRATRQRKLAWTCFFVFAAVIGTVWFQLRASRRAHPSETDRRKPAVHISDKDISGFIPTEGAGGLSGGAYAGQTKTIALAGNETMSRACPVEGAQTDRDELNGSRRQQLEEAEEPLQLKEEKKAVQPIAQQTVGGEAFPTEIPEAASTVSATVALHVPRVSSGKMTRPGEPMRITLPENVTMDMVWCPAGSFMMGSPTDEEGRRNNETQHKVMLTEGFWMAKTEVTCKQWWSVMGDKPFPVPLHWDDLPVDNVTWNDCQEFCRRTGLRLPTEAEWEYACRAESDTAYYWGNALNGERANCNGHAPCGTRTKGPNKEQRMPVGSYKPNAWGLYDMHGNVYEWCADWYTQDLGMQAVTNPTGPAWGTDRVLRGGGWNNAARNCRSAARIPFLPAAQNDFYGFRPVCSADAFQN